MELPTDSWTVNEPPLELVEGVNFSPASPWATVMNCPLVICVTPSARYSEPPLMPVISK